MNNTKVSGTSVGSRRFSLAVPLTPPRTIAMPHGRFFFSIKGYNLATMHESRTARIQSVCIVRFDDTLGVTVTLGTPLDIINKSIRKRMIRQKLHAGSGLCTE